jgi:hypothetical protein
MGQNHFDKPPINGDTELTDELILVDKSNPADGPQGSEVRVQLGNLKVDHSNIQNIPPQLAQIVTWSQIQNKPAVFPSEVAQISDFPLSLPLDPTVALVYQNTFDFSQNFFFPIMENGSIDGAVEVDFRKRVHFMSVTGELTLSIPGSGSSLAGRVTLMIENRSGGILNAQFDSGFVFPTEFQEASIPNDEMNIIEFMWHPTRAVAYCISWLTGIAIPE